MKKFTISTHFCDAFVMRAEDQKLQRAIDQHMVDMGESPGGAYFCNLEAVEEFLGAEKKRQLKQLADGWDITVLLDPWEALHAWGWDCHTLAEKGWK